MVGFPKYGHIWNVSNLSTAFVALHIQLHGFKVIFCVLLRLYHCTKVTVVQGIPDLQLFFAH